MHSLGINLLFDTAEISWDNAKVHMQHPEMLKSNWVDTLEQELLYAHDPNTMDAERIQGIILSQNIPLQIYLRLWKNVHTWKKQNKSSY
jgi:hypothetical protein